MLFKYIELIVVGKMRRVVPHYFMFRVRSDSLGVPFYGVGQGTVVSMDHQLRCVDVGNCRNGFECQQINITHHRILVLPDAPAGPRLIRFPHEIARHTVVELGELIITKPNYPCLNVQMPQGIDACIRARPPFMIDTAQATDSSADFAKQLREWYL